MNTEDRELLELAAKAAGIKVCHTFVSSEASAWASVWGKDWTGGPTTKLWNPFGDDGDAFRIVTHLRLLIEFDGEYVSVSGIEAELPVVGEKEVRQIIRRLIVEAAADIGRAMP